MRGTDEVKRKRSNYLMGTDISEESDIESNSEIKSQNDAADNRTTEKDKVKGKW